MNKILAVDFDGTIVTHEYPEIGAPVPGALEALKTLQGRGWKIILWTMRHHESLDAAVEYLGNAGIALWGINRNPEQSEWTDSPKAYAHRYVDDAAVGCPLRPNPKMGGRPYVDWERVLEILEGEEHV